MGDLEGENKTGAGDGTKAQISDADLATLRDKAGKTDALSATNKELSIKKEAYEKDLLSPEYLEFLENKSKGGNKVTSAEEGKDNYEDMTATELATTILGKVTTLFEGVDKKLDTSIGSVGENVNKALGSIDVQMTGLKHKDFGEAITTVEASRTPEQKLLLDTTHKVAVDNPTWGVEKCLKSARRDIKDNQEAIAAEAKLVAEKEGLALSEKGGINADLVIEKQLSPEEAGEKAFKASFGNANSIT